MHQDLNSTRFSTMICSRADRQRALEFAQRWNPRNDQDDFLEQLCSEVVKWTCCSMLEVHFTRP